MRRERRFWRATGPSIDRDVDDELAFHLAMRAELYRDAGLDPQTARDAALGRFGDLREVRARCVTLSHDRERRMRRFELWSATAQHTRHALRRLRAAPAFAAAVTLLLALGVGATTAVFSVVDGVLLRPLPFPQPERLVALTNRVGALNDRAVDQTDAFVLLYQRRARSFAGVGAYRTNSVNLATGRDASAATERVTSATVNAALLPTLRVAPALGRAFRPDDDRPGAPPVALISDALWRARFGGDRAVVGRTVVVDGVSTEVVGVMPAAFRYPSASTGVWLPLRLDPLHVQGGSFNFTTVARLAPDVTAAAAVAELRRVQPVVFDDYSIEIPRAMWDEARVTPVVTPLRDAVVGDTSRLLWILFGAVALLLVIACANVASLFLVRAEGSQRDLAVRTALGAGRGAVVAQYLGEAVVLGVAGGAFGTLLAAVGVRALRSLPHGVDLPRLAEVGIDGRALLFALATSLAAALLVSVLPVWRARRVAPGVVLKESSRSATVGRDRQRARGALVVAQVAIALVLVAGSALMARSFARLRGVVPGFATDDVATMRVALPSVTYPDAARRVQFFDRLLREARALPGVRDASVTTWLPLTDDHDDTVVQVEDHPLPPNAVPNNHFQVGVGATYFATMGMPLLRGRAFAADDAARPSPDVIISRAFAEQYWPNGNPLGRRLRPYIAGPWYTVVGVVGDAHVESLAKPAEAVVYFPLVTPAQRDSAPPDVPRTVGVVVRTAGDVRQVAPALRAIIRRLDPSLPTFDERPFADVVAANAAQTRFTLLTLGVASLVALVIGAVGLYGVMAYGVTLRRREIGVRIALGAGARAVSGMIARRGVALAALGVAAGLAATLATTRFLRGLLYDVSPTDPLALGATCGVLVVVATVASWLPARRAAAVDPIEALRRD